MSSNVIDTAINGEASFAGKAYFFKRNQYVRFDWPKDRMDGGYPLAIAATWRGLPPEFAAGIDAAINGEGSFAGKAYLFRGSHYVRYDWAKDRMDDNYPLAIAATWRGLPPEFAAGIDAAINGEGAFAGKAYLFKGSHYVRYDWAKDRMDEGYPLAIAATWRGLPPEFAAGIDAAINGEGSFAGKAYLFKGDQYVRYDWAKDHMDAGYPLPISGWELPGELS